MKERSEGRNPEEIPVKDLSQDSRVILISPFPFNERDSRFHLTVEVSGEFIKRLDRVIRENRKKVVVTVGENGVLLAQTFPITPKTIPGPI